jgi:hypothetical protein
VVREVLAFTAARFQQTRKFFISRDAAAKKSPECGASIWMRERRFKMGLRRSRHDDDCRAAAITQEFFDRR